MGSQTLANDEQRARLAAHLIEVMKRPPPTPRAGLSSAQKSSKRKEIPTLQQGRERFILFAPPLVQAILEGRKTVTRRIAADAQGVCPFGAPGDRLWVREKWGYLDEFLDPRMRRSGPFVYASDGVPRGAKRIAWRPSLHMPRAACRVVLHITATRIERLTQITREHALAEGCPEDRRDDPVTWFHQLWDGLSAASGKGWQANPWVWVISFEAHRTNTGEVP